MKILSKNFLSIFNQKYILVFAILNPQKYQNITDPIKDFPSVF
ncbi:hypothetical protein JavanS596_0005 [Streptococcus satellite phage Javan596]|nr:hypothetical protein JavanS596_0005 [Streptococcus satellite phage Javan596]